VPLLREGEAIGAITLAGSTASLSPSAKIALVKTFAIRR